MLLKKNLPLMVIKTLKNLSVPDQKDCIFARPDFKSWQALLDENKASLAAVENRNTSRTELVNIAAKYTHRIGLSVNQLNSAANIIVTGHQPNWHHCGIFAKNIITDKFARRTDGITVQLVLDHDICNTSMSLPESDNNGFLKFKTIPLEQKQQHIPLEFRPLPSNQRLKGFIDSVSKIQNSFCSEIWCQDSYSVLKYAQSSRNAADIITQLLAQLHKAIGLEMFYLPVSLMSQTECFSDFIFSIMCDALNFAAIYNQAIKNKRQTHKLKPNQTIKLLKTDYLNSIIELPFWLVSKTAKRASLYVSLNDKNLRIGTADKIVGTIDSSGDKKLQLLEILKKTKCVIRPKAVTLTLFVRIHLADLFVHGIGAENYEYITDHLIRDYYRISRLSFGIATATMTLPQCIQNQNPQITEPCLHKKSELSKKVINHREFFFGLFPGKKLDNIANSKETENENGFNCCPSSG